MSHVSYMSHVSCLMSHASCLMPHTLYRTSYLIPHASCLVHSCSRQITPGQHLHCICVKCWNTLLLAMGPTPDSYEYYYLICVHRRVGSLTGLVRMPPHGGSIKKRCFFKHIISPRKKLSHTTSVWQNFESNPDLGNTHALSCRISLSIEIFRKWPQKSCFNSLQIPLHGLSGGAHHIIIQRTT